MSNVFDDIKAGLEEALSIAKGEAEPFSLYVPPEMDVKAIRTKTRLTQRDFATVFGFTYYSVTQWERGRSRPTGGVRAYLMLIDANPEQIREMLRAASHQQVAA